MPKPFRSDIRRVVFVAFVFLLASCSNTNEPATLPDIYEGMAPSDWPDSSGIADLAEQSDLIAIVRPTASSRSATINGNEQVSITKLDVIEVLKGDTDDDAIELAHGTFFIDPDTTVERAVITNVDLEYLLFLERWSYGDDDITRSEFVTVSGPNGIFIDLTGNGTDFVSLNTENRSIPESITTDLVISLTN